MSFAERGVYFDMMLEQWEKRSLPDTAEAVAECIATTAGQVAEVLAAWDVVRRQFVAAESGKPRIYNVSLERTRRAQKTYHRRNKAMGKRGGETAARNRLQRQTLPTVENLPPSTPPTTVHTDLTGGEGTRGDLIRSDPTRGDTPRPVDARSKRPIFAGQKVTVFEWMLDECMRTLHPHEMDFDLHNWFFQLDAAAVRDGVIVPKKDGGEWLQAQLVAEAQRRGLPLQFATVPSERFGKQTTRLAAAVANIRAEAKR